MSRDRETLVKISSFEIRRVGKQPETISADSCELEGAPPSRYVFRKDGIVVDDVFVYALEADPKPIYSKAARTAE